MEEGNNKKNDVESGMKENAQIDELKASLESCEKAKKELDEYAKRAKASLENMRREKEEEINYVTSYANQKLVERFVEILDDMERIMDNFEDKKSIEYSALEIMYKKFKNMLETEGLKKIDTSGKFDPFEHDAVERIESPDHNDWDIVEVTQNGYKFKNKVIRPAKVKVALHVSSNGSNEGR
jgi:molecular chaperone GrpE